MKALRILMALTLFAAGAAAATPEESYIAARDQYVQQIKALEAKKNGAAAAEMAQKKALADLEKRLQGIIGDLNVKNYPARGKIMAESLLANDIGYGLLDSLRFAKTDNGPQVVVSTAGLLTQWLRTRAEWWKKELKSPPDANNALKSDEFYSEAVGSDAAFTKTADIPIEKPQAVEFAFAMLGGWAQDVGPNPRQEIVVALRKGDKIYLARERVMKSGKIPGCEAIWAAAERKANKAFEQDKAGGPNDEKGADASWAIRTKGDVDYRACLAARAPKEAFFPALTREAQAIADRFGGK